MNMEMKSVMIFVVDDDIVVVVAAVDDVVVDVELLAAVVANVPFLDLRVPLDNEAMIQLLAFQKSIQIHWCLIFFIYLFIEHDMVI